MLTAIIIYSITGILLTFLFLGFKPAKIKSYIIEKAIRFNISVYASAAGLLVASFILLAIWLPILIWASIDVKKELQQHDNRRNL